MSSRLMACLRPRSLLNASVLTLGVLMNHIFPFPKRSRESALGAPLDAALPAIVGFLAARFGLLAGLALLGSAPLLMLLTLIGYSPTWQKQEASPEIVQRDLPEKFS